MGNMQILQTILGEFYDKLKVIEKTTARQAQFFKAENKIKVAIGMRRSGKTFFIYQHILRLLKNKVSLSRILFINFEDDRLLPLNREKLANLIEAFYSIYPENHNKKCYIFLDEIQNIEDWAIVVRRIFDSKNIELFLSGSSAKLLSKEIATSLRGRSLATEICPYSFQEYLQAKKILTPKLFDKKALDLHRKIFSQYLTEGGFPEVTFYDQAERQKTLQEYIDVVLFRDIIERHNINNPSVIKYMIISMIHNVSNPFSINKFYNDIKTRGYKISRDLLYEYAGHLEDAFLCFFVPLYDRSIRKKQSNPKKVYAIDSGLIRAVTLDFKSDLGKLFENIVYLDLRRLGCEIHYYLTKKRYEIDFIVKTPQGKVKFFQVVWDINDRATFEREVRALEAGKEELQIPGEIITLESYLSKGIDIS